MNHGDPKIWSDINAEYTLQSIYEQSDIYMCDTI